MMVDSHNGCVPFICGEAHTQSVGAMYTLSCRHAMSAFEGCPPETVRDLLMKYIKVIMKSIQAS
jgi:hypothetical protein